MNDCFIKAVAVALLENPALNCQVSDTAIHRFHGADISVVMAVEGGLATPVVRNAETKSVRDIAAEVKDLGERARRNALKFSEISGGSFSLSNLGGYGVEHFDAIINPPQCAILAVGSAMPRVLADHEGNMRIATTATFTLSVDHCAADGADMGRFFQSLRGIISDPDRLA